MWGTDGSTTGGGMHGENNYRLQFTHFLSVTMLFLYVFKASAIASLLSREERVASTAMAANVASYADLNAPAMWLCG